MKKRIIAIDCDDVIVETAPAIIAFYNKRFGAKLDLKNFYSNDPAAWAAEDNETAIRRVDEFLETEEYQQLPPFQEAIEVIRQLSAHHELHIVTGRSDFLAQATEAMFEKYFPDIFASVEYTNFFGDKPRSKADVCQALGADLLIDDHLHHATVVAECGTEVYLFGNYPWNQSDQLPQKVTRVTGWQEIGALLLP